MPDVDPLTGLPDRNGLLTTLERRLRECSLIEERIPIRVEHGQERSAELGLQDGVAAIEGRAEDLDALADVSLAQKMEPGDPVHQAVRD